MKSNPVLLKSISQIIHNRPTTYIHRGMLLWPFAVTIAWSRGHELWCWVLLTVRDAGSHRYIMVYSGCSFNIQRTSLMMSSSNFQCVHKNEDLGRIVHNVYAGFSFITIFLIVRFLSIRLTRTLFCPIRICCMIPDFPSLVHKARTSPFVISLCPAALRKVVFTHLCVQCAEQQTHDK